MRTATDLALRYSNVRLTCPACGHVRILSGVGLWWLFHRKRWSDHVGEITRRLYCGRCHARNGMKVSPRLDKTKDAPTGKPLENPSDHEWKRLIARYRS